MLAQGAWICKRLPLAPGAGVLAVGQARGWGMAVRNPGMPLAPPMAPVLHIYGNEQTSEVSVGKTSEVLSGEYLTKTLNYSMIVCSSVLGG